MDQEAARRVMGVGVEATGADVLAAYGRLSRKLKRRLVEATTVEGRDRARRALKSLVTIRDVALGPHDASELKARRAAARPVLVDDWWRPEDGVPVSLAERVDVLRWLGVDARAGPSSIRRVLEARTRQLKQRIARAASEYDLHVWQQTLVDLRRIGAVVTAKPAAPDDLSDTDETATETPVRP
jgi:hypothetical protein